MNKIYYTLILSTFYFLTVFSQRPVLRNGFPIIVDSLNFAASQPVIVDIDEDGSEDIIVSKNSPPYLIFVYNLNGEILDGWPQSVDRGTFRITAGDIDGDGHIEIIARTTISIFVFKKNGSLVTGFPQTFATSWDSMGIHSVLLFDCHSNNTLDIVTTNSNRVFMYHNDGTVHPNWPVVLHGRTALMPATGDINIDGEPELIVSSFRVNPVTGIDSGWIYVLSKEGNNLPGWPMFLDSHYVNFTSPTLVDINNDDSLEIVLESHYRFAGHTNSIGKMNIFSPSGKLLKKWYNSVATFSSKEFGETAVADINGDDVVEIATSDRELNNFIFDINGNNLPGWPVSLYQYMPPKFVDITNDSIPEVFINDNQSTFPADSGKIHCLNIYGKEFSWSPFRVYGNTGVDQPIFSDMDNDGSTEMVLLPSVFGNFDGYALSVYTFPGANFTAKGSPWPQLEHDRHNTYQFGYVPSDNVVGIAVAVSSVPEQFSLKQNYPNPFNPQTAIGFSLLAIGNVTLKVYDVLGREIATLLNNETMQAGKHAVNFNVETFHGTSLPSGVYFYRLSVDGKFSETKKLVLMK